MEASKAYPIQTTQSQQPDYNKIGRISVVQRGLNYIMSPNASYSAFLPSSSISSAEAL